MNVTYANYVHANCNCDEGDGEPEQLDEAAVVKAVMCCERNVPPYIIARQLECVSPGVLKRLAEDPKTDARTLVVLSHSGNTEIREAVADNENAPFSTLLKLAHDIDPDVRFQVAENHNIPGLILEILTEDENPYIRWRAETTLHRIH